MCVHDITLLSCSTIISAAILLRYFCLISLLWQKLTLSNSIGEWRPCSLAFIHKLIIILKEIEKREKGDKNRIMDTLTLTWQIRYGLSFVHADALEWDGINLYAIFAM